MHLFTLETCPKFVAGDGVGGTEIKISTTLTGERCVKECMSKMKNDKEINGVTIRKDGKPGCWCEKKMNRVSKSSTYKTCLIDPKANGKFITKYTKEYKINHTHTRICLERVFQVEIVHIFLIFR